MGTISVEIEAVRTLAVRIRRMKADFEGLGQQVGWYHEAVGSHRVADRLGDFATNWSHEREKLGKHLDELAVGADGAADTYAALEAELARAATPKAP